MPKHPSALSPRILLLEDDYTLSAIIEEYLSERGFEIICAYDGNQALDLGYEAAFDLFLLDVKVPHTNGFDVLRELRKNEKTSPAIFMTSLNTIDDLSTAYDAGCDDYLKKPFELKELELRINALLKRAIPYYNETPVVLNERILFDAKNSSLTLDSEIIPLSRKEVKLLSKLIAHSGEIVDIPTLIDSVWDFNEEGSEESLRTHIKNLRKYLGKEMIINIRGQGYRLANA